MFSLLTTLSLFPLEEPVLVFTLALAGFLVAPLVIKRAGLPGIVGIVLFGTFIGPFGLGLIEESSAIELLGTVGLVYLLFTVGLELDLRSFVKEPQHAALFGLTSFLLPFTVGTAAGHWLLGLDIWASLLLAAVFSSHTLIAYPTVNQLDITKNRAISAVFGGILFTDTLALVVLAIALGAAVGGGLSVGLVASVLVSLAILFGLIWFVIPPIAQWFFQSFSEESYYEFLFVAVVFFAAASLAESLGLIGPLESLDAILGAFVAGIALNRQIPRGGTLMNRIEFLGNAFFIPFFLLYVGMQVNPSVILDGLGTIQTAALIIGVMVVMKFVAAWLVAFVQGYTPDERGVIFGLSVGQAAAALAITLIGFDQGLFGEEILNAVVLMMLVAAVISPALTQRYGRRIALETAVEPGEGGVDDPRLLLPLSTDADRQRQLLELGFVLKDELAEEPIHLMTVVQPDADRNTEETIAAVEADLARAAEFGGAAEVPIVTETRLNHNIASGIVRGSVETRADMIVMGWDANATFTRRIFGDIIDRVLNRTTLPVLVSRLGHPVNTTKRIFVVLPHGVDHHEGFYESVHIIKRLTDKLGAELCVLVVDGRTTQYENLFKLVEPDVDETFEEVSQWGDLLPRLEERADPDDLVLTVSPREGSIGWSDHLADLPQRLLELPPHSFIVIYPREGEPEYDAQFLKIE
ncbi:cation:proton antiporter [Natronobiforma cellulositropha]|uniref:cation:proton antiporter n=1 Tax=Natronobiforma cellulositropha TaxID=1679076 RepID=UPI0021D5B8FC|nr:cation:proton antiporter [Natronobiforma cellulositropha]